MAVSLIFLTFSECKACLYLWVSCPHGRFKGRMQEPIRWTSALLLSYQKNLIFLNASFHALCIAQKWLALSITSKYKGQTSGYLNFLALVMGDIQGTLVWGRGNSTSFIKIVLSRAMSFHKLSCLNPHNLWICYFTDQKTLQIWLWILSWKIVPDYLGRCSNGMAPSKLVKHCNFSNLLQHQ